MSESPTKQAIETAIKLAFLAGIIAFSLTILAPFGSIMAWSIILAMALSPTHKALTHRLSGKSKVAATIIVLTGLLIILVPSWLFVGSIVDAVQEIRAQFEANTLTIPPPTESVKDWPFIGDKFYAFWDAASQNLQATIVKYQDQLADLGNSLLAGLLSVGGSIGQFVVSTIIAGVLLATKGTWDASVKLFNKLLPNKGDEVAEIAQKTVNNVVKGVLGVGLIQGFFVGIGFLLAGIPYAGLWTLIVFILAVLQLPVSIITIPAVIYLFAELGTVPAVLWTIYLIVAGLSDNFLKPILLGKGAPVPMLVIFLGVIGGFITMGFIGLFIGAIMLSLAYKLYMFWVNDQEDLATKS